MKKLSVRKERLEFAKNNPSVLRDLVINEAILDKVNNYKFTKEEKEELDFLVKNDQLKFFLSKQVGEIKINEEEIATVYSNNKQNFDSQNINFAQAKNIIGQELTNIKYNELENNKLEEIIKKMKKNVEISSEDIIFSKGDANVIKTIVINKVVEKVAKDEDFFKKETTELSLIEENVKIKFYVDLLIRKDVVVTEDEIRKVYENEKSKLGNITPNSAYQQIAQGLMNNKVNNTRAKIIEDIVSEYQIDKQLEKIASDNDIKLN